MSVSHILFFRRICLLVSHVPINWRGASLWRVVPRLGRWAREGPSWLRTLGWGGKKPPSQQSGLPRASRDAAWVCQPVVILGKACEPQSAAASDRCRPPCVRLPRGMHVEVSLRTEIAISCDRYQTNEPSISQSINQSISKLLMMPYLIRHAVAFL